MARGKGLSTAAPGDRPTRIIVTKLENNGTTLGTIVPQHLDQ